MNIKDNQPIYVQIANYVCDKILSKIYEEENRILSMRELGELLQVNANTVFRAYEFLQNKGFIYNKRGVGYFVSSHATAKILSHRKDCFLKQQLPEFCKEMQLLHISIEELTQEISNYFKVQKQ
jgi:DNA-binding transcriptional regulator YhcF (GntR family)